MNNLTFLLTDENPVALTELTNMIRYLGYDDVQQSENASNAYSLLQVKEFGCLISAWEMTDMSGLALLKIVRTTDKNFNIPFFLTDTAYTRRKVIQAGQAGATGLIVQPYDPNNLRRKIDSLAELTSDPELVESERSIKDALELIESNNYGTALGILENLTKKEENAEFYYNIGYIKTAQNKYSEAIEAFRKATMIDRLYAKAFEGLGRAYQKLGRKDEAEKCLYKAAEIHMTKENVDHAEEVLNEIMQISPDTVNIYNSLGVLYRKKGEYENALVNYQKALKIHPDRPRIHYNIGRLHLEMKDPEKAKASFHKALKIEPTFTDAKEVLEAIELGTF